MVREETEVAALFAWFSGAMAIVAAATTAHRMTDGAGLYDQTWLFATVAVLFLYVAVGAFVHGRLFADD